MNVTEETIKEALPTLKTASPERVARWLSYRDTVVTSLLSHARETNDPLDWAKLARSMRCQDEGFQNAMYLLGSNTKWPKVLAACGATQEEINLASQSAHQINTPAAHAARWQRLNGSVLSRQQRREDALQDLQQRLSKARQLEAVESCDAPINHAKSAAWADLSRTKWIGSPLFGVLTKRRGWGALLDKIGATKDEIDRIESCGRSAATVTYTDERGSAFQRTIMSRIAEARSTNEPSTWASLARGHWENHPDFFVMCRQWGKSHTDWNAVLRWCGISEKELKLVLFHRRSLGQVTFTDKSWLTFKQEHMLPLLVAARAGDEPSTWDLLSRAKWEQHKLFSAICCFTKGTSWYDILARELGVTPTERDKIEGACRSRAVRDARGLSDDKKNATLGVLKSLIATARESGRDADWTELSSGRWESMPGRGALCREFGRSEYNWSAVLAAAGATVEEISGITSKTISLARRAENSEVTEMKERLTVAIAAARQQNNSASWAALAGINWMKEASSRELAGSFGNTRSDWQGVLRHFGLTTDEINRVRIEAQRTSFQRSRSYVIWEQRLGGSAAATALPNAAAFSFALNTATPQPSVRVVIDVVRDSASLSSDAQLYRRLVGTRLGRQDWDALAELYERVFPRLRSTLSTAAGLSYVSESIGTDGWPSTFPRVIASVGSGIGSLYRAADLSAGRIKERHKELPTILDVDPCDAMRERSPNPNKIAASAGSMRFEPGSLDAIECSSVLAMGPSEAAMLITKASSALKDGGLLWLKVDGARFGPGFEEALQRFGFALLTPLNARLMPREDLADEGRQQVADALRSAHFIFTVKERSVQDVSLDPALLTFTRNATSNEQLEKLKDSMRALRMARDDATLVSLAEEFVTLTAAASHEAVAQAPHVWISCLWAHAKTLYPANILPRIPTDKMNDSVALTRWVGQLQSLLDTDDGTLASVGPDSVREFVHACRIACARLSSIVGGGARANLKRTVSTATSP